jgi:hypothetical protein
MQYRRGQLSSSGEERGAATQTASCHLGTLPHAECQLVSGVPRRTQVITETSIQRVGLGHRCTCNSVLRSDTEGGKDVMLGSPGIEHEMFSLPRRSGGRGLCKSYLGSCSSAVAGPLWPRRSKRLRRVFPGASSPVVMGAAAPVTRGRGAPLFAARPERRPHGRIIAMQTKECKRNPFTSFCGESE